MAYKAQAVRVEGLRELRGALGKIDRTLQKNLRGRLKKVGDAVAADIRETVPVGKTGKARASVKSGVGGNNAYIQGGKKTVPYFGWLDFGGELKPKGKRRGTQRRAKRPRGRYIYPGIDRNTGRITRGAVAALEDTKRDLGLH